MDRRVRSAMRDIRASGAIFDVIIELMDDLRAKDRKKMFRLVRFHHERALPHYGPREQKVAVKFLSDHYIEELIARTKVWQLRGKRTLNTLILEEANYRGLETVEQAYWSDLAGRTLAGRAVRINKAVAWVVANCDERGGHRFMLVEDEYVCTNCRKKVTCEEVSGIIDNHHGQWLRQSGR